MRIGDKIFILIRIDHNKAVWKLNDTLSVEEKREALLTFRELGVDEVAPHVLVDSSSVSDLEPPGCTRHVAGAFVPGTGVWFEGSCLLHRLY